MDNKKMKNLTEKKMKMSKNKVEYMSYIVDEIGKYGKKIQSRTFLFYVNHDWDEEKRTYKEAIEAYPKNEYQWIKIDINE